MEEPDNEKWRVCSFCFKAIPPPPPPTGGEEEEDQVLQQFLTIFATHVRIVNATLWRNVVTSCPKCSLLMTTFCKLHHQIKSLELMAEWKIRQLKDVVTTVSKVQSRTEAFEKRFKDDEGTLQDVGRFRKEFVSACDKQLSKSLPRVSLTRCLVTETSHLPKCDSGHPPTLEVSSDSVPSPPNTTHLDAIEPKLDPDTFSDSIELEKPPEVDLFAEAAFESHFQVGLVCSCGKSFESELKLTNHSKSCSNSHQETRRSIRLKMDLVTISKCLSRLKNNWKFLCTTCKTKFPSNSHLRKHQRGFFHILKKVIRRKRKWGRTRSRVNQNVETIATSKQTTTESVKQVVNTEENGATIGMLRPLKKTRKQILANYKESDEDSNCSLDDEDGDSTRFSDSSSCTPDVKPNRRQKRARSYKKKTVRAAKRPRPYKCEVPECQFAFELKEYLENHSQLHGQFPCSFCKVVEDYAPNLAVHEASVHSAGRKAQPRKKRNVNKKQPLQRRPSKDFVCPRCDFSTFSKALYLNHHAETHLGLSRKCVSCPICSARFVNDKGLTFGHHMKTLHDTKGMDPEAIQRCDQCPAYFRKGFQLSSHKRTVHGVHHLSCKDCRKKFSTYFILRNHRRSIHKTNEANFCYICDVPRCEQRFETLNELEWHTIGLHNGKKEDESVICSECGRRFADWSRLKRHRVVHDEEHKKLVEAKRNERKFVCEKCGKKCFNKTVLATHYLFHEGPQSWEFSCLFCEKRCFSKQKLWDHLRTHTKEKPFPCKTCEEEYAHAHNLRNHMNTKHGANVKPRKYNALQLESKKGRKLRK